MVHQVHPVLQVLMVHLVHLVLQVQMVAQVALVLRVQMVVQALQVLQDKVFLKNYLKLIPLNRMGKPEDMANIVCFLASEQSAFITGQGIVADGGQMSGQNYARVFGNLKSFKSRQRKT